MSSQRLVAALLASIVLAACGSGGASKITLRGGMSLTACGGSTSRPCQAYDTVQGQDPGTAVGKPCTNGSASTGVARLDDIASGTQVTVKNEKGALIASGRLEGGAYGKHLSCRFPFSIPEVPSAKFYIIEVSHRGAQTYSSADLAAKHNDVELTLDANPASTP